MTIAATRRLALASGLLAAPALLGRRAQAQTAPAAPAAPAQAPGFYRFKLGGFTVTTLHDGAVQMPLAGFVINAPLEQVQGVLAESFMPGDSYRNIFTATMVDTGRGIVLFDTGLGLQQAANAPVGKLRANMIASGVDPKQVTTVVLSHFHGDHINGLLAADGTAAFPNAEIVVPAAEWAWWTDSSNEARSPERQRGNFANTARRFAPYQGKIRQIGNDAEVVPGIRSISAFGHTPGHTIFVIADGNAQMMYVADTSHRPELVARRPEYQTIFDFDGAAAAATRARIYDRAAADRVRLTGFHFPFPATGWLVKDGPGYRFVPADWTTGV